MKGKRAIKKPRKAVAGGSNSLCVTGEARRVTRESVTSRRHPGGAASGDVGERTGSGSCAQA
ncbi:hypothetical protein C6Q14_22060 [Burkholderia ambifaria]|nr:hypothetical protein C6Q14_22060 [Burkholderia ambifaria]QDW51204.1 hypothetical protein FFI87_013020 [Burkholderia sp. KBS0801]